MRRRNLTILIAAPLLLAAIVLSGGWVLMHTHTGANWILSGINSQTGGSLETGEIQGDLGSGLEIRNLRFRNETLFVESALTRFSIDVDFIPPAIQIGTLTIQSLKIRQLASSPEPADPTAILSALASPIPVELENMIVEDIQFFGTDGTSLFSADKLLAKARLEDSIEFEQIQLEMEEGRTQLTGSIGLAQPYTLSMNSRSQIKHGSDVIAIPEVVEIRLSAEGALASEIAVTLESTEPDLHISGTLNDLLEKAKWDLDFHTGFLELPMDDSDTGARFEDIRANSTGNIDDFTLAVTANIQALEFEDIAVDLQARGSEAGLVIESLGITGQKLEWSAAGEMQWQEGLDVFLTSTLHRLDPTNWIADWPEKHPLKGNMVFRMQGDFVDLQEVHLEGEGTSLSMDGNAKMEMPGGQLSGHFEWTDLGWPVGSEYPKLESQQGQADLQGSLDNWTLNADADLKSPDFPQGSIQLQAIGDSQQASMDILEARFLGGTLKGDVALEWSDGMHWSTNLVAEDINTVSLSADWPARFNADLSAEGQAEPFAFEIDFHQLDGDIRRERFTGSGRIRLQGKDFSFNDFSLQAGDSTVDLQGSTSTSEGLGFRASIVDFSRFLPSADGAIQAQGRLSLLPENPSLVLNLEGEGLAWEDVELQHISIRDNRDVPGHDTLNLRLEVVHGQWNDYSLDGLSMDLKANQSGHSLILKAQKADLELSTGLSGDFLQNGSVLTETKWADRKWAGHISSFSVSDKKHVSVELKEPTAIGMSARDATLTAACITAGIGSELCLDAAWEQPGAFSLALNLDNIPLNLAQPFFSTDIEATQNLDGDIKWASVTGQPPSGHAMIRLSPGEVRYVGEQKPLLVTGQGMIGFVLENGRLSSGNFDVPLPGVGEIDIDFNVPDVTSGRDSDIAGKLKILLTDLDAVSVFMPIFDQLDGKFDADINLSGSLNKPLFTGSLSLTDGLLQHDASGLLLNEIQLAGQVRGNDDTVLSGSFRALEGTGQLQANLDLTDVLSPGITLSLQGDNLTLLDAPDLQIIAEPDVQVGWRNGVVDIRGSLLIPKARIAPGFMPSSTISESPDLVIVAGELPAAYQEPEPQTQISLQGTLDVILGEDIEVDLDVAVAKLTGNVNFAWDNELLPMANGNYSLVGDIHAFGQSMQITEGNIGFPDVPADNPHLNIRAERQIFGNSEIRRAGVFVTGTLRRPVIEPFTDPATNRDRARTLLITGSDFNMEEGVGAIDIGTYIAPRIFVSYGIGVFEDENVISIRYDLGRNWGIEATSGQSQTGVDISYTLER